MIHTQLSLVVDNRIVDGELTDNMDELFSQYRNTNCVLIETGILGGGSLFMWRNWLGPNARIIGIDLNPAGIQN